MKGSSDRTKVVMRHLPPSISQSALMEQVDSRFAGRYNWVCFRPGKSSQKHQAYSRAYLDFNSSEDVVEFAEFFDGHVFVNEKGTQFKTIVEYAPSQRVPNQWSKKDGREGTIFKDPEFLEFLEFLAKPVENLPSAEIQLERKEAERAGAPKDSPIVTPLMDYVRQRRAAKSGSRRSSSNGRLARRTSGTSSGSPSTSRAKRGAEKRRISTTMYVQKDSRRSGSKDKLSYVLVPKRDDVPSDKSVMSAPTSGATAEEENSGTSGFADAGTRKILLKGKDKAIPLNDAVFPVKNPINSSALKQNQRHDASGRIIRSILLNKDGRRSQSVSAVQPDHQVQISNQDKDKRPPRPPAVESFQKDVNGAPEDRNVGSAYRLERRSRSRDRPDRGVWTPLRRSDSSDVSNEFLSSFSTRTTQVLDSSEGSLGEIKNDMLSGRGGDLRSVGSGRGSHSSVDNVSYRHSGHRGLAYAKNGDGSSFSEGKHLKRGVFSGYGSHEKQVWVQKSSSGS